VSSLIRNWIEYPYEISTWSVDGFELRECPQYFGLIKVISEITGPGIKISKIKLPTGDNFLICDNQYYIEQINLIIGYQKHIHYVTLGQLCNLSNNISNHKRSLANIYFDNLPHHRTNEYVIIYEHGIYEILPFELLVEKQMKNGGQIFDISKPFETLVPEIKEFPLYKYFGVPIGINMGII
jgi:hypothetical protein